MSKIKIVFTIAVAFILSGCTIRNTPNPAIIPSSTPATKLLTWADPAVYFEYPEEVTINNHPEDTKNYANLT